MENYSTAVAGRHIYPTQNHLEATPKRVLRAHPEAKPAGAPHRLVRGQHFDTYLEARAKQQDVGYVASAKDYGGNGVVLVLHGIESNFYYRGTLEKKEAALRKRKPAWGKPRVEGDATAAMYSAWRSAGEAKEWIRMEAQPGTDYRLLTGNARGGIKTREDVGKVMAAFRREVDRHYPGVKMLAVPELHHGGGVNDGTFHVHMVAIFPRGKRPIYSVFHRMWYRALGGTGREFGPAAPGNLDFADTHSKGGHRYTACQAARYLTKYMFKDVLVGNVGQKRYSTSHVVDRPKACYWWEDAGGEFVAIRGAMLARIRAHYPEEGWRVTMRSSWNEGKGTPWHVFDVEPWAPGMGPVTVDKSWEQG